LLRTRSCSPRMPDRGVVQLLLAGLEQLVARQALEDVAQRLPAVADRRQPRLAHHVLEAVADQRDVPRPAVVGAGGVQPEEPLLGDRLAGLVEPEDADVVHVARTVHGGTGIGLGKDEGVDRTGVLHVVRGQRLQQPRLARVLPAQQPQAGVGICLEHFLPFPSRDPVLAVAQEGEVVVGGPVQELLRLAAPGFGHRHPAFGEVPGDLEHPFAHRRPVADDRAHVAEHLLDTGLDRRHRFRALAVDLKVHERLAVALAHLEQLARPVADERDHRVAEHVHADPAFGQGHGHRVDQERHVPVHHLQHRMRRLPVVPGAGVEHPHVGRVGLALAREVEEIGRQRRPALGRVERVLGLDHAFVEGAREGDRLLVPRLGQPLAQRVEDRFKGNAVGARDGRHCTGHVALGKGRGARGPQVRDPARPRGKWRRPCPGMPGPAPDSLARPSPAAPLPGTAREAAATGGAATSTLTGTGPWMDLIAGRSRGGR
jgi:hypothetical protein